MIVDEHLSFRNQLEAMLRYIGCHQIDHAANISEAAHRLGKAACDVIFLGVQAADQNVFDFIRRCREEPPYDELAFIIVSADAEKRHISEALKAGAIGYIKKPVLPSALQKNITKVAGWKERLGQLKA